MTVFLFLWAIYNLVFNKHLYDGVLIKGIGNGGWPILIDGKALSTCRKLRTAFEELVIHQIFAGFGIEKQITEPNYFIINNESD